jgi:hypothetical protein
MPEQLKKPKENKSKAVASSAAQKKSNVKQGFGFMDNRPASIVQKIQTLNHNSPSQPVQKKESNTGLSDNLKTGIEKFPGYSMGDVNVNYDSDKRALLNANAQGTDIYIVSRH